MKNIKIAYTEQAKEIYEKNPPQYETEGSVGIDLRAIIENDVILKAGEQKLINLGIMVDMPANIKINSKSSSDIISLNFRYEMQLRPRSGLASKFGISLTNTPATIDSDYKQEVKAIIINHSQDDYTIVKGERIVQAVFSLALIPTLEFVDKIEDTGRGGFGSTGTK